MKLRFLCVVFFLQIHLVACGGSSSSSEDDSSITPSPTITPTPTVTPTPEPTSAPTATPTPTSTPTATPEPTATPTPDTAPYELEVSDRVVDERFSMAALLDFSALSYESSNPEVASVAADGTVTVLSEGTAVISAFAENVSSQKVGSQKVGSQKVSLQNVHNEATSTVEPTADGAKLEIVSIPNSFEVTAWVGANDTEFSFSESVAGLDFFSSRDDDCDFINFSVCSFGQHHEVLHHEVGSNTIIDTATTIENAGYYVYNYGRNRTGNSYLSAAKFEERQGPAVAVYDEKMWLIGGAPNNSTVNLGDVWSSVDGDVWVRETELAPFGVRYEANALALNGKLWVLNGLGDSFDSEAADVWSTSNGRDWTQEASNTGMTRRYGAHGVVFNNKLFIAGGFSSIQDGWLNDMWYSSDGIHWSQVPQTNVPSFHSPDASLVAHNNKLWLLADSVWSSTNGIDWVEEVATAPFADYENFHSTTYNGEIWLFTYTNNINYGNLSRVYTSSDGVNWNAAYGGVIIGNIRARESKVLPFKQRLFLVGGRNETLAYSNEVLSSTDGHNWINHGIGGLFGPRSGHSLTVHKGRLWAIGGMDDDTLYSDVWVSDDAVKWELVTADGGFPPRHGHAALSFNDQLCIIGGAVLLGNIGISTGDIYLQSTDVHSIAEDVWCSDDGITWTERPPQGLASASFVFQNIKNTAAVVYDNRMWVIGAAYPNATSTLSNDQWSSTDGVNWDNHLSIGGTYSEREGHAVAVHNGYIYLSGGRDANGEYQSDVWRTTGGSLWELVTDDFIADNRAFHQMISFNGNLYIIAGRANYHETLTYEDTTVSEYNDIWVSEDDGFTWTEVTSAAPFEQRRDHRAVVFNNKIIMTGGQGSAGFVYLLGKNSYLQDVWATDDGINWRTGFHSNLTLFAK